MKFHPSIYLLVKMVPWDLQEIPPAKAPKDPKAKPGHVIEEVSDDAGICRACACSAEGTFSGLSYPQIYINLPGHSSLSFSFIIRPTFGAYRYAKGIPVYHCRPHGCSRVRSNTLRTVDEDKAHATCQVQRRWRENVAWRLIFLCFTWGDKELHHLVPLRRSESNSKTVYCI